MYCANCGTKLLHVLSYCNHCGANVTTVKSREDTPPNDPIDTVVWVMVGMTVVLLGMGLGALVLIKDGAIDEALGRIFVLLSFVAFVVVEGVLLWRLLYLHKLSKERRGLHAAIDSEQSELNAAQTRALNSPGEPVPVPTVTEQTTRNLEPSYREVSDNRK